MNINPPPSSLSVISSNIRRLPITENGLLEYAKELFSIYLATLTPISSFGKADEKTLATIYKENIQPCQYLGKIHFGADITKDSDHTERTATRINLSLAAIFEKIAYDFYKEFGKGFFEVPSSCLSLQPIMDQYTLSRPLARTLANFGVESCVRILSKYPALEGYQDFSKAQTRSESGDAISFVNYVNAYHKLPETLLAPDGSEKPIFGLIELLAVIRVVADVDGLGASAGNAGFVWVKDSEGVITRAQVVKIDPGCAFSFFHQSTHENFLLNAIDKKERALSDLRDIQTAANNSKMNIHWQQLSSSQKNRFLSTLVNCLRYKNNPRVLELLTYRQGKFKASKEEKLSKKRAEEFIDSFAKWLALQEKVYAKELDAFKKSNPGDVLKIHFLDYAGEFTLPMTRKTFLIKELFTNLVLAPKTNQTLGNIKLLRAAEERPSDDAWVRITNIGRSIPIEKLFNKRGVEPTYRILITGAPGIGKSTLCQKIAHDWAMGQLFQKKFHAIYWLPLRVLNGDVQLKKKYKKEPDKFIAFSFAKVVLKSEQLAIPLLEQLTRNRQKVLLILDGYDEADPELRQILKPLLTESKQHLIVTSRQSEIDTIAASMQLHVEALGFNESQIETYCKQFFYRVGKTAKSENECMAFLRVIKQNQRLFRLAHTPLKLLMLCSLWEEDKERLNRTTTELIGDYVQKILVWSREQWENNRQSNPPGIILLGNYLQSIVKKPDTTPILPRISSALEELALAGIVSENLIIPRETIVALSDKHKIRIEDLLSSGLIEGAGLGRGMEFSFLHLSFQEYLAARHLSNQPVQQLDPFFTQHLHNSSYEWVITSLAGIIYQNDHSANKQQTQDFFNLLCKDWDGNKRMVRLLLRCLNECPGFEASISNLEAHKENLQKKNLAIWASEEGLLQGLRWCVSTLGPSILENCGYTKTPMLVAIKRKDIELLNWLYAQNPELLQKTSLSGETPWGGLFTRACIDKDYIEVLKWLWNHDPSLKIKAEQGQLFSSKQALESSLCLAAAGGNLSLFNWLWSEYPTVLNQFKKSDAFVKCYAEDLESALATFDWFWEKKPFPELLENIANHLHHDRAVLEWLKKKDLFGTITLRAAIQRGDIAFLSSWWQEKPFAQLLQKTDKEGNTVLHLAVSYGKISVLDWLWGVDPCVKKLFSQINKQNHLPLHIAFLKASEDGDLSVLNWLWERVLLLAPYAISKNEKNFLFDLAYKRARDYCDLDLLDWLWQKNLLTVTESGFLLHSAIKDGNKATLDWTWEKNPDISLLELRSPAGQTPLQAAFERAINTNDLGTLQWIWSKQPNRELLTTPDFNGPSLQQLALGRGVLSGKLALMNWCWKQQPFPKLLSRPLDEKLGQLPVHIAAKYGHVNVLGWLWIQNPSRDSLQVHDFNNQTPLSLATSQGHVEVLNWLWERCPDPLALSTITSTYRKVSENQSSPDDENPLAQAVKQGHTEVTTWYCEKDPLLSRGEQEKIMASAKSNYQLLHPRISDRERECCTIL